MSKEKKKVGPIKEIEEKEEKAQCLSESLSYARIIRNKWLERWGKNMNLLKLNCI